MFQSNKYYSNYRYSGNNSLKFYFILFSHLRFYFEYAMCTFMIIDLGSHFKNIYNKNVITISL